MLKKPGSDAKDNVVCTSFQSKILQQQREVDFYKKVGVVVYPVSQAYGSLALDDNSEVGEEVLGRCSISCVCTSAFYLPTKEADPLLVMDLVISPTCEVGVAGSIPGRTICKRAWTGPGIPLLGFSDQP